MADNREQGSPPHLWGIRVHLLLTHIGLRITPTPVGNTLNKSRQTGILILRKPEFCLTCFYQHTLTSLDSQPNFS